jgi:hypothetical protein
MASISMSRAALEQALKEILGRQADGRFVTFQLLLSESTKWSIFTDAAAAATRDLAQICNRVLHESPSTNDDEAFEVLSGTRSVLEELYSRNGGY